MLRKISNLHLFIILIVLLLVIGGIKWWDSRTGNRNFRKELSSVDSSAIKSIYIYPSFNKENEIVLYDDDNHKRWEVNVNEKFGVPVDQSLLQNILSDFSRLNPERIVANEKKFWSEYGVDSSGKKVLVINRKNKRAIELVVGKPAFQNRRSLNSYVRLFGENEIYETNTKLSILLAENVNAYRQKEIFSNSADQWDQLIFKLPSFGSYELNKEGEAWFLNGQKLDSAIVQKRFEQMQNLGNLQFNNELQESDLQDPDYKLIIHSKNQTDTLKGFAIDSKVWITSTHNPVSVIDAKASGLFEKLFFNQNLWLSDTLKFE